MLVYIDTGALIALNDRSDPNHAAAEVYFHEAARTGTRFVIGRPVCVEYLDGVTKRVGKADAITRMRQIDASSLWRVEPDLEEDHARARELFIQYDDAAIDMTDSLSFAIMERLGLDSAFTFDSDYQTHGLTGVPSRDRVRRRRR